MALSRRLPLRVSLYVFALLFVCVSIFCNGTRPSRIRVGYKKPMDGSGMGISFADFRNRVVVISISADSPAARGGLLNVGNIILGLNGEPVGPRTNAAVLGAKISAIAPGGSVIFYVEKHSVQHFSTNSEDEFSLEEGEFIAVLKRGQRGYGLHLNKSKRDRLLKVENIVPSSSTAMSRILLPGDTIVSIDGSDVTDIPFREIMKLFTKSAKIKLRVKSGSGRARAFIFQSTINRPKTGSFGIKLKRDYQNSVLNCSIFIESLVPGSVADMGSKGAIQEHGTPSAALFAPGDRVLAIGEHDVKNLGMKDVVALLKAVPIGASVAVKVARMVYLPKRSGRPSRREHERQKSQRDQRTHEQTEKREKDKQHREEAAGIYRATLQKTRHEGLGIRVASSKEGIMVEDVLKKYTNKIRLGDIIVAVGNRIIRGLSFDASISLLKAVPVGRTTTLTLQRSKVRRRHNPTGRQQARASTRRPNGALCKIVTPDALKRQMGKEGVGKVPCAPAKFGKPLSPAILMGKLVVPNPVHACEKLRGEGYRNKILLVPRGKCFFHEKAIHAQRAGAIAMIISNSRGDEGDQGDIFQMEMPDDHGSFAKEPVTIPLVLISHLSGKTIARHTEPDIVFEMIGTMDAKAKYSGADPKSKRDISKAKPEDLHENPQELVFDFLHGTLELNLGTPGAVGNPRRKMNTKLFEKTIPFEKLYTGGSLSILLSRSRICPQCHGHGGVEGGLKPCPNCSHHAHDELGRHVVHDVLGGAFTQKKEETCSVCHGHGEVLKTPAAKCPTCNGQGVVKKEKTLRIRYPPGMRNGWRKLFPGEGFESRYGAAGDVEVVIKHEKHVLFERYGADLITTVGISLSEALLGFNRSLALPDNSTVSISKVGITRPGSQIIKPNMGLPVEVDPARRSGRSRQSRPDRQIEMGANGKPQGNEGMGELARGDLIVRLSIDFSNLGSLRNRSNERIRRAFGYKYEKNRSKGDNQTPKNKSRAYRNHSFDFRNVFSYAIPVRGRHNSTAD